MSERESLVKRSVGSEVDQVEAQNKEAARQLSIILIKRGVNCRIVTVDGFTVPSVLRLGMSNKNLSIFWRSRPEKLGCELRFMQNVVKGILPRGQIAHRALDESRCIGLVFIDFKMQLETVDAETCAALHLCLQTLLSEVKATEKTKEQNAFNNKLRLTTYKIVTQQEKLYQLHVHSSYKEGAFVLFHFFEKSYLTVVEGAIKRWVQFVAETNAERKKADKQRWRLHAVANMDIDLQAWYHSIFHDQVYRVRGPFWFREAALATYRRSYDLVHNTLTALEENALAHVLCSQETSYGDVAGQMFTVQEIVDKDKFELFQRLAASGIAVVKYPRIGRPAKKMFRLSFVEGCIYLTWKGKFGTQGVELNKVSAVKSGICTEITRKQAKPDKASQYLSLLSVGRSLDLFFESIEERQLWQELLTILVSKELGELDSLRLDESEDDSDFECLIRFASICKVPKREIPDIECELDNSFISVKSP